MNNYDEPLEISAPIAWDLAARHCRHDPATGVTCAWNHGLWQLLRRVGLAGTAAHRGDFYHHEIRSIAARTPRLRLLISGCSDYAMLAQVARALDGLAVTPDIVVLDICATPLHINRWYADRLALPIKTVEKDFLNYTGPADFDIVCTDSLLGRFPHEQWPQVAARWRALLRPNGYLLTASRLRPADSPARIVFSEDQVHAFRETVRLKMQQSGFACGIDPDQIAAAAEQYGQLQCNHPLRSEQELRTLLEQAGLAIEFITPSTRKVDNAAGIRAPTVPGGGAFLQVVAKRQ